MTLPLTHGGFYLFILSGKYNLLLQLCSHEVVPYIKICSFTKYMLFSGTVKILNIGTYMSEQTV